MVKYHGNYLSLLKANARRVAQRPGSAPGEVKGLVFMTRDYLTRGNTEVVEPPDGKPAAARYVSAASPTPQAAMRRLLAGTQLAASLGARARARILEEYTVERMIERTVGVYRLAIARAHRAQPA